MSITGPTNGTSITAGVPLTLTGTALDEDGDLAASLAWTSSLDGALGTGASVTTSALSIGTHTLTAAGQRQPGPARQRSDQRHGRTPMRPPRSPLRRPSMAPPRTPAAQSPSRAAPTIPRRAIVTASLAWSSDLDGALGTGASVTTSALSVGTHTITASATDSLGATGSSTITLTVNGPPAVTITAPADASSATEGAALTLNCIVVDEDGDLSDASPGRPASTAPSAPVTASRPPRSRSAPTRSPPPSATAGACPAATRSPSR